MLDELKAEYNIAHFYNDLEAASYGLGEWFGSYPKVFTLFPMTPKEDRNTCTTYMINRSMLDADGFNSITCLHLCANYLDEKIEQTMFKLFSKVSDAFKLSINSDERSPLIKAALFNYYLIKQNVFPKECNTIANLLCAAYLYCERIIPVPYFYLNYEGSKHIHNDANNYISSFLGCVYRQSQKQIDYIHKALKLHIKVNEKLTELIKSPQAKKISDFIFSTPILDAQKLASELNVTRGQAVRLLHILENEGILKGDDKQRSRTYYFEKFLNYNLTNEEELQNEI